ncbi:MAG: ribosome silencing factor [Litoreibacter sp.]|nr:ribosome silencing factor [Litoreibacter sp.]
MSQHADVVGKPTTSDAGKTADLDPGTSEELLAQILNTLTQEKAEDIVQVDLRGRSEIADYMVICSGRSTRQVSALSEKLVDNVKHTFGRIAKIEGKNQGDWVLIDTGDVVVHIFRPEVREFYQLEKMWLPSGAAATGS